MGFQQNASAMQQMQNGFNAMGGEQDAGSAPGTQPSQQTLLYQQQQQMMLAMQQVMSNGYGMGGMGAGYGNMGMGAGGFGGKGGAYGFNPASMNFFSDGLPNGGHGRYE